MGDIIIQGAGDLPDSGEHCPACEARFSALEQRLAAIESHHPIMDANTSEAQETADAALAIAEEAQQEAQAAGIMAVAVASEVVAAEEEADQAIEEDLSDDDIDTGATGSEAEEGPGSEAEEAGSGETESSSADDDDDAEPVVIQLAPDKSESAKQSDARRYRFARGKR